METKMYTYEVGKACPDAIPGKPYAHLELGADGDFHMFLTVGDRVPLIKGIGFLCPSMQWQVQGKMRFVTLGVTTALLDDGVVEFSTNFNLVPEAVRKLMGKVRARINCVLMDDAGTVVQLPVLRLKKEWTDEMKALAKLQAEQGFTPVEFSDAMATYEGSMTSIASWERSTKYMP